MNNDKDSITLFKEAANELNDSKQGALFEIVQNLIKVGIADSIDGSNSSQKQRIDKIIAMLENRDLSGETK